MKQSVHASPSNHEKDSSAPANNSPEESACQPHHESSAQPQSRSSSSEATHQESKGGRTSAKYDHDLKLAEEEVVSNVKEVLSLNQESQRVQERRSALSGRRTGDEEVESLSLGETSILELVVSMMEVVREPLMILDGSLIVKKANLAFYRTFGYLEKDVEERSIYDLGLGCWRIDSLRKLLEKVLLDHRAYEEVEVELTSAFTGRKTLRLNVRRLSGQDMILMSARDVTQRRRTEVELNRVQDELRQGQKMEIVGRLAGGVAHDFNNILTGILGFSELLLGGLPIGSSLSKHALEIKKASERAAALTHQLLAFSRRQVLRPQLISLDAVLHDLSEMLQRLMGDHIKLVISLGGEQSVICADAGQVGQVILNLAINARDAMPQAGTLNIQTSITQVEEGDGPRDLPAGSYVRLRVTDSGTGMDLETQQHIFEPFFTTKPPGEGTGLGLSLSHDIIVKQHGGTIDVDTSPGEFTEFLITLPRVAVAAPKSSLTA